MKIKNWINFQHYKDRAPPWIKLHKALLDDYEFQSLPLASRALAPMLWLLASESTDGNFDGDLARLAFRLRRSEQEIRDGLMPLIEKGFVIDDSNVLATCLQHAVPETEREAEAEAENTTAPNDESFIAEAKPKLSFDDVKGEFLNLNGELGRWRAAYPAIHIETEIAKAAVWLMANPKNRKSNYARFLANWLSRAQDRAPRSQSPPPHDDYRDSL